MCSIDKQATSAAPRLHPPLLRLSCPHVPPSFLPPQVPLMLSNHETTFSSPFLSMSSLPHPLPITLSIQCHAVLFVIFSSCSFLLFQLFHFSLLLSVAAAIEWPFDMEDCNGSIKLSMSTSTLPKIPYPHPAPIPQFYLFLMCVHSSHFS